MTQAATIHMAVQLVRLLYSLPVPQEIAVTAQEIAYVITLHQYVSIEIVLYPTFNHVCVVPMVFATKTMVSYAPKQHQLAVMHQHVKIIMDLLPIRKFVGAANSLIAGHRLVFIVTHHILVVQLQLWILKYLYW